jgi:hypothetical protein
MNILRSIAFLVVFAFCFCSAKLTWTSCASPEDLFDVGSLTYSPDTISPGTELSVTFDGNLKEQVSYGSYASLKVKMGIINIPIPRFDICSGLEDSNAEIQCPIQPGAVKTTVNIPIPRVTPRANYAVELRLKNDDGRQLSCFMIKVQIQ